MGVVTSSSTLNNELIVRTQVYKHCFLKVFVASKEAKQSVNNLTEGQVNALRTGQETRPEADLS